MKQTIFGRFYVFTASLVLGAPFVFLTGVSLSLAVVIVATILAGSCNGLYNGTLFVTIHDVAHPTNRANVVGFTTFNGMLGGALAPYVIGSLAPTLGLGGGLAISAAFYLIVGLLFLVFKICLV